MQQRLSSPQGEIKRAYDVVVVGSGYGGGVAASRLSRAGQSVCVIEKGKEFPTGSFPSRLPELRRELQLNGGKMRSGSRTGLFDFRLGADIHVLVGCGLGGGSLINAGVALKPDATRLRRSRLARGACRATGCSSLASSGPPPMLRPARYPNAPELTKYRALEAASAAFGVPPVAAPVVVSFEDIVNPAGVAQPACTLCGDCCSGCNVGAKNTVAVTYLPDAKAHGAEIFTELSVSHIAKGEGGWRVYFAPSNDTDASPGFVDAEHRGARRRHARLDRDPAAVPRARARPLRPARRGLLRQWRHHRLRARRQRAGERRRRWPPAEIRGRRRRRLRGRADRAARRRGSRPRHDPARRRAALGARAAAAGVLHRRRQAARRRAEPDQGRLSRPAVPSSHLLRGVPRRRAQAASGSTMAARRSIGRASPTSRSMPASMPP